MLCVQLAAAYNGVERSLCLLGVTAVEDRLQEDVKQTIERLGAAGIRVWVLTGDKEETAVNIAYSAGLFDKHTQLLKCTQQTSLHDAAREIRHLLDRFANTFVSHSKHIRFG